MYYGWFLKRDFSLRFGDVTQFAIFLDTDEFLWMPRDNNWKRQIDSIMDVNVGALMLPHWEICGCTGTNLSMFTHKCKQHFSKIKYVYRPVYLQYPETHQVFLIENARTLLGNYTMGYILHLRGFSKMSNCNQTPTPGATRITELSAFHF
jgi:hypothetical protein